MAANNQGGNDPGAEKNAYYVFWLVVLVVIVTAIIWHYFHYELKLFFIYTRIAEFQSIYSVLNLVPRGIPYVGEPAYQAAQNAEMYLGIAKQLSPPGLSVDIAEALSTQAGNYLRYPLVLYAVFLGYVTYKRNVRIRLKTKFNMKTLAKQEQYNWPQIKVIEKLDLLKEDLEEGPWAMGMTPVQFCRKNQLIYVEPNTGGSKFSKISTAEYKVTLNRVRTGRAFSAQLGRPWRGVEHLPQHRRAIFSVLAARGSRLNKEAEDMMLQLANSAAEGEYDYTGVDELCKKLLENSSVQKMTAAHAYELTLFISLVQYAREDGVVPASDFLWVKPFDRRLWYTINSVGRQTPFSEVGGVFCHWNYEMALRRPLFAPRVEEAVDALAVALSEVIYQPTDEEKEEIAKREEAAKEQT